MSDLKSNVNRFFSFLKTVKDNVDKINQESKKFAYKERRGSSPFLIKLCSSFLSEEDVTTDISMFRKVCRIFLPLLSADRLTSTLEIMLSIEKKILPNLNTLKMSLSNTRKWAKTHLKDEVALKTVLSVYKLTEDEWSSINKKMDESKDEANEKQVIIKKTDIDKLFDEVNKSNNISDLIVTIMMTTGRRFIETIISTFKPSNDQHHLLFSNRAKERPGKEYPPLRIPLLYLTAKEVLDKIKLLREKIVPKIKGFTNKEINSSYNKYTNDIVSKFLGNGTSSHTLRKLYALMCYKEYKNDCSFNAYIKDVLGHDNLKTSLNYTTVRII